MNKDDWLTEIKFTIIDSNTVTYIKLFLNKTRKENLKRLLFLPNYSLLLPFPTLDGSYN